MSEKSRRIREFSESVGEDFYAEIDAKANDPNYLPEPVKWRDHADPLNMNWSWLFPDRSSVEHTPDEPTIVNKQPRFWRNLAVGATAAAILFCALFLVQLLRPGPTDGRRIIDVASIESRHVPVLGTDERIEVRVEAPFDGFVTVISLADGRPPRCHPDYGETPIRAMRNEPSGAVYPDDDTTRAVAVVTATVVSTYVAEWLDNNEPLRSLGPDDAELLKSQVLKHLESLGHKTIAVGIKDVEPIAD